MIWLYATGIGLFFIIVLWQLIELFHRADRRLDEMVIGDASLYGRDDLSPPGTEG